MVAPPPTEEYDEGSRPRIRWPELHAGDTVEVALRTWTKGPIGGRGDAPFYFMDYAGSTTTHPLMYNEVIVESPPEHPIYVDVVHGAPDRREDRDERGRHIVRLIWDAPISVPDEPFAPALSETLPLVLGSTFHTWFDFRAWYTEAVSGFTEPDAEIRRLASELTKGKTTRDAKLASLFNFVADDIRYVNYVSGESWLPNRPQQLLARREGDCDDKAILLITLLKAVGVESCEVLVQTRMTGQPSVLRAKGVAIPLFDHGIAVLNGPKGEIWLDATGPQSRLGPLPSMDARGVALRLDGPPEIVDLPPGSTNEHGSDSRWVISMQPNGAADLSADESYSGDSAYWLRTSLTEEGARRQFIEEYAAQWFPTVEVNPAIEFHGDLPRGQARVTYRVHSEGYARREGDNFVVSLAPSSTFASRLAPLISRQLPTVLPPSLAPSHDVRSIRLVAPRGFHWGVLPFSGTEDGDDFGHARFSADQDPSDPHVLRITRELVWDLSTIPVDRYTAWRDWVQRVDRLTHKEVRLIADKSGTSPSPTVRKGS